MSILRECKSSDRSCFNILLECKSGDRLCFSILLECRSSHFLPFRHLAGCRGEVNALRQPFIRRGEQILSRSALLAAVPARLEPVQVRITGAHEQITDRHRPPTGVQAGIICQRVHMIPLQGS